MSTEPTWEAKHHRLLRSILDVRDGFTGRTVIHWSDGEVQKFEVTRFQRPRGPSVEIREAS